MAWTEADAANLRKAIASGVLSVSYDGPPRRSITYQSLDAMRSLLAEMTTSSASGTRHRLAATRKGL